MRCALVVPALLVALIALPPGAAMAEDVPAPELPPAVEVLPEDLFAGEPFHAAGDAGACEIVQTDGARGFRITVERATENRWDVGLGWNTVAPIEAGDVLVLRFRARAEGPERPPGSVHLAFRRVERPYMHALNHSVEITGEWADYALAFSPTVAMDAGGGTLRVNLGAQPQTIELRELSIANYGHELSYLALVRMLDLDPGQLGRRPVHEPLRPGLLWEMQAFDALAPPEPDFDPSGAWTHTYRIWTCHGYLLTANSDVGFLRLTRTPGDPFELSAEQRMINHEGLVHAQSARITCALDALASPLGWELRSTFVSPESLELNELAVAQTARLRDGAYLTPEGERAVELSEGSHPAADWCLFEAVQRLPFSEDVDERFDLLEGLSLVKPGHRLRYTGAREVRLGQEDVTLHRFVQTGRGMLPYEWWLDEAHRLVMVVTHSRVYILDPVAPEELADELQAQVARWRRLADRQAEEADAE